MHKHELSDRETVTATFSLPPDVACGFSRICKRLGVSRSALLGELLRPLVEAYDPIVRELPASPTAEQARRARGKSLGVVRSLASEMIDAVAELDGEMPDADAR